MKFYNIPELQKIAKEQSFPFIALLDVNDQKIIPFNKSSLPVLEQFKRIEKRFNSSLCPNGEYKVLMSDSLRHFNANNKFSIYKGEISEAPEKVIFTSPVQSDVLSWNNALNMVEKIATLNAENTFLKKEVQLLQEANEELKFELQSSSSSIQAEEKTSIFGEAGKATNNFLNENGGLLINLIDKHFSLKEREISLKEGNTTKRKSSLIVGSEKHIQHIKKLFDLGKEEELNKNLDLLENFNKALHDSIIKELNVSEEEEPEEEEEP